MPDTEHGVTDADVHHGRGCTHLATTRRDGELSVLEADVFGSKRGPRLRPGVSCIFTPHVEVFVIKRLSGWATSATWRAVQTSDRGMRVSDRIDISPISSLWAE